MGDYRGGVADNQISTLPSVDGKVLTFQVPQNDPNGELCDQNNKYLTYNTTTIKPGIYAVSVANKDGVSNEIMFTAIE